MSGKLIAIIIVICALALAAACGAKRVGIKQGSKHGRLACSSCHVSDSQKPNPLKTAETELCATCHPNRVAAGEHIVGVKPKSPVKNLPLRDGLVACSTCHEVHGNVSHRHLLRLPAREICSACHNK